MKKVLLLGVTCFIAAFICVAAQCQATTKKGTQCKRQASSGSSYCWQHGGATKAQRGSEMPCKQQAKESGDGTKTYPVTNVASAVSSKEQKTSSDSVQCDAMTKKGLRCTRKVLNGGTKCWQHVD